ncbi:alpha-L-fucosidase [bacterium]|nr:alpha-L-fucosidase [bacterium]
MGQIDETKDGRQSDRTVADWQEMHDSKREALEEFNQAKFGMFIHWGLYSIPGGVWKGLKMEDGGVGPAVAEWIMCRRAIPRAEYAELAKGFNPVGFDADAWASIAADAGMRYMALTSKHHDGFALFQSEASSYNVVDGTPFKRDIVHELHKACPRHDVRFGVYYSHSRDWTDGGDCGDRDKTELVEGLRSIATNHWDPSPVSFQDYLRTKALPQVEELARRYPDLFLMWFDTPGYITEADSFRFYRLLYEHAPQTLANSRISANHVARNLGDYQSAGDNHVPEPDEIRSAYWETCGTMNNSWGYKSYDQDWKSPLETLSWLVDVVSRGGNYLLNVGPTAEGVIPPECVAILREVGAWLKINGEAIYGTRAWKVFREGPTSLSRKGTGDREKMGFAVSFTPEDIWFTEKEGRIYAITLASPGNQKVVIRSLKDSPVRSVRMLGTDRPVDWEMTPDGLRVRFHDAPASPYGYALEVRLG